MAFGSLWVTRHRLQDYTDQIDMPNLDLLALSFMGQNVNMKDVDLVKGQEKHNIIEIRKMPKLYQADL